MTDAARIFVETYQRQRDALAALSPDWLKAGRDEAMDAFAKAGLPHRRLEDWRYTDLARLLDKATLDAAPVPAGEVALPSGNAAIRVFEGVERYVVTFVNGRMQTVPSSLGLPAGVTLSGLGDALSSDWGKRLVSEKAQGIQAAEIVSLNTALMAGGFGLHLEKGVELDKPLHLVFLNADNGASHTRCLIRMDEGAAASIYETHIAAGGDNYFVDLVSNVSLADKARLSVVKVQAEADAAAHLATLQAVLGAGSTLSHFTLTQGAGLSRGQSFTRFSGEGGQAHINGATALKARQHGDQFCITDHAVPHCSSATLFRTVLDDASTGIFQGKVIVRPHAQKTDGRQMSNALLLSRDAAMNAKPELEIYADDVQCAHGSTIGELNREALFYLRSRGIDELTARQLLISAFLDEAFETVPDETAREGLRELAAEWFRRTQKEDA